MPRKDLRALLNAIYPAQPVTGWKPVVGSKVGYVRYGPWYRRWYTYCRQRVRNALRWIFWHIIPGVTVTVPIRQSLVDYDAFLNQNREISIWLYENIGYPRFGIMRYSYHYDQNHYDQIRFGIERYSYRYDKIRLRWDQRRWATMILMRWS